MTRHTAETWLGHGAAAATPAVPLAKGASPPEIRVRGLSYRAGGRLLIDIPALDIDGAGPTIILGANGAGKSVLMRLLHGLLAPAGGTISVGTGRQAMVFQRPVVLRRTVAGNVAFALRAAGVPRRDRPARIAALLKGGGLSHRAGHPARLLSGGEQQRLTLLRAMATDPAILFLDEPTSSLDPASTAAIEALVRDADRSGTRVVMVTHDPAQARRLGARIALMHQGRLAEMSPTDRFFAAPASPEGRAYLTAAFLL